MTDAPPQPRRPVIGIVGTFDVANFGDLLFPEIAAVELERRLGPLTLHRFSHRPMATPDWPFDVHPIDELLDMIDDIGLLLVGGGDLVRFDRLVAPGYEAISAGLPHPTGYWLSPTLIAAAAGVPVAWNALGVTTDPPTWASAFLSNALRTVDYVAVRDRKSLDALARVGGGGLVRLVPDTAFGIRAVLAAREPRALHAVRTALDGRPYVIVQASPALEGAGDQIRTAVDQLTRAGIATIELPVSPVLGDRIGALGGLGTDAIPVASWPEPLALANLVAGANAVIAHSLHLSIVALAHGIPVIRRSKNPASKYELLDSFPGVSYVSTGEQLAGILETTAAGHVSTQALERSAQLEAHWDEIAALWSHDDAQGQARRRRGARWLLAEVPGTLADADADQRERVGALEADLLSSTADRDAAAAETRASSDLRVRTAERLAEAAARTTDLAQRSAALEVELARTHAEAAAERGRLDRELVRRRRSESNLRAKLKASRRKAARLDQLRRRWAFRMLLAANRTRRSLTRRIGLTQTRRGATAGTAPVPSKPATRAQEQALQRVLLATAPGSARTEGPLVSIIVLTRDGGEHLRRLLPALERTTYRAFELIVVDNGSTDDSQEVLDEAASRLPLTVIRNAENRPFGEANAQGVTASSGELLLFLNNDVEPVTPGWLGRLVDTSAEQNAVAVGARLVYPRRQSVDAAGDTAYPDLTLQHRGTQFVGADGVPMGRNLGVGDDPLSPEAAGVHQAAAVTAACMLVRRDAFDAVDGYTPGYLYGTEDVDLSMKLRANGGTIVYDGGAVLWHHEYGTQNAQGKDWKRRNRVRNRRLFIDRWGPLAFREVFRDRVLGNGAWSESPLHVAVTLTRDDATAGWGDYYTAHELGQALADMGWQVTYAERYRDRWYDLDPTVDVVISLLDAFDVRRVARGIVTVAWVRNWTDRWIDHPWFDEYDVVLASSDQSREIIASRTAKVPRVMALATNPERFAPRSPSNDLRSDVLFVGNSWGPRRGVEDTLPTIAAHREVRVYGRAWENTDLAGVHYGTLEYEQLPEAYASARVVLDDTAGPTMPYGAVNARVFDALAAGALVVSDNETGVRALFGDEFPVARTATELEAFVAWAEADPVEAAKVQARLRDAVLERHTYAHRAIELRDHLLAWVDSERYAILVGVPDWERAPSWGDYHFARDLQRQLEQRGHPTRIHLLSEWGQAPAARADVVVHLHGLSDHRPRPAQLNLLWIISHPDRVTADMCDRYDIVFVASDPFAATLAERCRVPVLPLHQATDPNRFVPDPTGPAFALLFVANTRGVRRQIIDDLMPTPHDLAIIGKGWTTDIVDPRYVRGDFVPNSLLNRYYASARIVLNDHWTDMRDQGFLSNRLYDALASGAFIISDHAVGIDEEFDRSIETYRTREELRELIDRYIDDAEARHRKAERGRAVVLAHHTFANRADRILEVVSELGLERPTRIAGWPTIEAWVDRGRGIASEHEGAAQVTPGDRIDEPSATPEAVESAKVAGVKRTF